MIRSARIGICLLAFGAARAESPRPAEEALATLGVVTHLDYLSTPYADVARVAAALEYLGLRNLRDMTPRGHRAPYERLAARGFRFNFVIRSEAVNELQLTLGELEKFQTRFPGAILSLEGLNEIKIWPATYRGQTGFESGMAVQRDLYRLAKRSRNLSALPVLALTLGGASAADHLRLGDLSDFADLGNAHVYFDGRPPWSSWRFAIDLARQSTPRRAATAITETGYSSAQSTPQGVPEEVQAKYLLMLVAEAWRERVPYLYLYQLVDDRIDDQDWSRSLGLYRHDWSPKPAAHALHHLTRALRADSTVGIAAPEFKLLRADPQTRALPLRRTDGSLALLVWREVAVWNERQRHNVGVAPHALALQTDAADATLVDTFSGARRQLARRAGGFEFEITDRPAVLILTPQSTYPRSREK